jgi:hypothetical protein
MIVQGLSCAASAMAWISDRLACVPFIFQFPAAIFWGIGDPSTGWVFI